MKWFQSSSGRLLKGLADVYAGSKASLSGGVVGFRSIKSVEVKRGESVNGAAREQDVVVLLQFIFFASLKV